MRTLTIERRDDGVGQPVDVTILSGCRAIGEIKADEKTKTLEIWKGEHTIQCEVTRGGNHYRSNVIFLLGSKNVSLLLDVSTTRVKLTHK